MKILITGASDGIGLQIAKLFAAKNDQVTLVARSREKLEAALQSLPGKGHQVIVADLSKKDNVDGLKELIENMKYDIFINNAGVGMYGHFTAMPLSEQVKMMNLNINALTALSYFYLGQAQSGNTLVNVASFLGTTSYPGAAAYAASKAYVINFSESLWWEYKSKGVYVLGFCPGATYTNFHNTSGGDKDSFPKFILQTPEQVAKELIRAVERRKKPKVISGGTNRFLLGIQKFMSRRAVVNMMAGFGPLKEK
jgi:short-subunit dehydrogenase